MRRVMVNSIGFILGFSVVFITLGAISTEIGQVAARYKHTLSIVAGRRHHHLRTAPDWDFQDQVALYRCPAAQRKGKQHSDWRFRHWICLCFRLDSVPRADSRRPFLTLASEQDTLVKGILLLGVYSLGLAVPFLLTSLLMERFLKFYSRFRSHMHALEVASGGC